MIQALRQRLRPKLDRPAAVVPSGERVYAMGDVHGRVDLFDALADAIEVDDAGRGSARTTVVLLGDLIDRGPDSAAVLDRAMAWQRRREVRIIAGNHEEMFLLALRKVGAFRSYLRIGGRETFLSYPIDADAFHAAGFDEAQAMACAAVPQEHVDFVEGLEEQVRIGDYLFVHAGIMPRLSLDAQRGEDLRWIREPFLNSADDHGAMIVHGHTISDEPAVLPNRIGIDTGAFMSGRLTALGLEGADRWLIAAQGDERGIAIEQTALPPQ